MTSTPLGGIPGFTATGPLSGPSDAGPSSSPSADRPGGSPFDQFTVPTPAPAPRPSSGRPHRGPVSDTAGNEWSTTDNGQPPMPAQQQGRGGALSFKTPSGRNVPARQATADTLVMRNGVVENDLGSLLASGLVEETDGGYRWAADGGPAGDPDVGPDASSENEGEHQGAQPERTRFDDQYAENNVEYLRENHTALYEQLAGIMSEPGFNGIVQSHILEGAARQLGVSSEEARAVIANVSGAFQAQWATHVGSWGINPEQLGEWLKSDALDSDTKEAFRKAVDAHANNRDLSGWDAIVTKYLAHLAETDPAQVMDMDLFGDGTKLRRHGTAIVADSPAFGEVDLVTALRRGWVKPNRAGKGSKR